MNEALKRERFQIQTHLIYLGPDNIVNQYLLGGEHDAAHSCVVWR